MSIYIRGMKMPKSCSDCKIRLSVGCCGNLPQNTRMPNCPLIEVPPHGDLIDRDMLEVQNGWLRDSKYFSQDSGHTHITFVYSNDIYNAPIIIESEEGE